MFEYATAAAEKADYVAYWSNNAGSLASQGCYDWMAEQLDDVRPTKVLDIGCGTGEGLLALSRRFGCEVVAIDENLECLRRTYRLLRDNSIRADLRTRFKYRQNADATHSIIVDKGAIGSTQHISLIQADVLLTDAALHSYLQAKGPFDAVTLWLIGAFQCRQTCADLRQLNIANPQEYRLHVQNRIYASWPKYLRDGGALQIVDRGEPLDSTLLAEDCLSGHREQASLGPLRVQGFTSRLYNERATRKGVEMVISPGLSGRIPNLNQTALVSVISLKP